MCGRQEQRSPPGLDARVATVGFSGQGERMRRRGNQSLESADLAREIGNCVYSGRQVLRDKILWLALFNPLSTVFGLWSLHVCVRKGESLMRFSTLHSTVSARDVSGRLIPSNWTDTLIKQKLKFTLLKNVAVTLLKNVKITLL